MSEIGDNGHLRSFVERLENIEAEIKDRNDDKREIYSEAKGAGYDPKILKRVLTISRQDPSKRREEEEILGLYLAAIGEAP